MSSKKCIFILGMHRSGTSAFTGVLNQLGADLGTNMMKTADENEKGFFENNSIYLVHEKILASLGSAWDSLFPLPESWWRLQSMKVYKDDLKEIIQKEFRGDLMAIKDPRLCKLLPLWKEIMTELQIDYCAIFPLRNPVEVARSLRKRNGFSMEKSAILWATHTFEAELYSRDCPRVFLAFDELLKSPQKTIADFASRLQLHFPKQLPALLPEIQKFLEPNLKHHHLETKGMDQGLFNDIQKWYQLLLGLTPKNQIEIEELQRIDALRNNFINIYQFFYNDDLIQQERLFQGINQRAAQQERLIKEQESLIQEKDYIIADKNVWLTERERQIGEKNRWIEEKERHIMEKNQLIAEKDNQIEEKNLWLEEKNQGLAEKERQINEKTQWLLEKDNQIQEKNLWLEEKNQGLAEKERQINEKTQWLLEKNRQIEEKNQWLAEKDSQIQEKNRWLAEKDSQIQERNLWLAEKDSQIQERNLWLAEKEAQIQQLTAEKCAILSEREQQIASFMNSTSWRVTAPLRKGMRLFKKILKKIYGAMKRVFHLLPISVTKKQKFRQLFYKVCKPLIKGTQVYQNYLQEKQLVVACAIPKPVVCNCADEERIWENLLQGTLQFQPNPKVRVSIIIPVFNQYVYTYNCLKSIYDDSSSLDYEIIVIDDRSEDRTQEMLSKIKGIRVYRNKTNLGFIGSCNYGAEQARGDYLVFLNNDTMVTPHWLDWLLKTFEIFPEAGLVGAKLIFPDGRLQEAGGIIWKDGSACNYARLEDPERPENNYLREVDYCSGACIMIPRELFFSVGLFDKHYAPAYYEDVDLAFKVRAAGKKVFCQPQAAITHFEGITSGTDTSKGIKQYQVINQAKFYERWKGELSSHGENGMTIEIEKERYVKKRMLIIDECICLPDQDAGSLRMFNLIQIFQELGYKITFFPHNLFYPQTYVGNMQGRGIEVLIDSYFGTIEKYLNTKGEIFDVVILSRANVAKKYIDMVNKYCRRAKVIFDTVDLHFLREGREAELKGNDLMSRAAEETKNIELEICSKADITLVVSHVEKEIIESERPDLVVKVVPTIQEIYGCKNPFSKRSGILFIGGFRHTPNVDAMVYFVQEILPLIRGRIRDLKTYIIGSNPPEEIQSLAGSDVIVTGYVADVEPYFNQCRLSIAPLRWGAGIKGKINLSMSYGVPVVGTPLAVEGMFLQDGVDVMIGASPSEFAVAVIRLYNDKTLWNKLSVNGIENIRKYFSFEVAKESVREILIQDEPDIARAKHPRRVTVGR